MSTANTANTANADPIIELAWAIKASFLSYVGSAGGTISLAPPARWTGEHFVFPLVQHSASAAGVALVFGGEVALNAYGGMLDVQIAQLTVVLDDDRGTLSASTLDGSRSFELALLTRRSPAAPENSAGAPVEFDAALHDDAVTLFGDVYPPGTALDPVYLSSATLSSAALNSATLGEQSPPT